MNSKLVKQYNVVNKLDTNFKTPEDKRMYQRDYQRLRYQNDPEFRKKVIDRCAVIRQKNKMTKPKDLISSCILTKFQQGPKPDDYCIHIPKKKGRPIQIDENGIRFFKSKKF
jgi:hypothetical protein